MSNKSFGCAGVSPTGWNPSGQRQMFEVGRSEPKVIFGARSMTLVDFPASTSEWRSAFSELTGRLHAEIEMLRLELSETRAELSALGEEIRRRPRNTESALLVSLGSVVVRQPIPVTISEYEGNEWVVTWPALLVYGSGETRDAAMAMFASAVADLVEELRSGGIGPDDDVGRTLRHHVEC